MQFRFKTKKLEKLYTSGKDKTYPSLVIKAFFRVMTIIVLAADETLFYQTEQLHYEKLKGARGRVGERSMQLWDGWRLIVQVVTDEQGKEVLILEISNHYQ
ncbi:MAG: type II toxin-antitoxin system RelE/ParE family toxin [Anaerolineae bacterium]